jgi:hypothetical protein
MSDESGQEKVLGDNAGVYIPSEGDEASVEMDFGGFIVGLYQSALIALGHAEHPELGGGEADLEAARHTIDILRLLQEKTKGNLDQEEERLMKGLLYELKVAFVEATGKG